MKQQHTQPGLFGQKHASRDYTQEKFWGKNQFNSSFPASLVAYMYHKGIDPVYLCIDRNNEVVHKYISGKTCLVSTLWTITCITILKQIMCHMKSFIQENENTSTWF